MEEYDDEFNQYENYTEDAAEEGEEYEEQNGYEKPSEEEKEYLQLRERIKAKLRKNKQNANSSHTPNSQDKKKKPSMDNYGSFFGPSRPIIAQRVIQESKLLLENPQLASRQSYPQHDEGNLLRAADSLKNETVVGPSKINNDVQQKIQTLKSTRDYSFLDDDSMLPVRGKPATQTCQNSEERYRATQAPQRQRQPCESGSSMTQRNIAAQRLASSVTRTHSKTSSQKPTPSSKPKAGTFDFRKKEPAQLNGHHRLPGSTALHSKPRAASGMAPSMRNGPEVIPKRGLDARSLPMQTADLKKGVQQSSKAKLVPKQPASLPKQQINKPAKPIPSHVNRAKKRPVGRAFDDEDDEDEDALNMIRKMFNTQRFAGRDDESDSDMEVNFEEIQKEERRSAKIARKEDEEQLRLLQEEEERERLLKLAKKQKLSHR